MLPYVPDRNCSDAIVRFAWHDIEGEYSRIWSRWDQRGFPIRSSGHPMKQRFSGEMVGKKLLRFRRTGDIPLDSVLSNRQSSSRATFRVVIGRGCLDASVIPLYSLKLRRGDVPSQYREVYTYCPTLVLGPRRQFSCLVWKAVSDQLTSEIDW